MLRALFRMFLKFQLYVALLAVLALGLTFAPVSLTPMPDLETGDLIFQTSDAAGSPGIVAATRSLYSHMGIVEKRADGYYVLDSAGTVEYHPLQEWLAHGYGKRFAVYRRADFSTAENLQLLKAARNYLGTGYDMLFLFDNEALYCSELPYLAYKAIGAEAGKVERVRDLSVDNPFTRKLIEQRWNLLPHCQTPGTTFAECYRTIMNQEVVTPVSFARDPNFTRVYSNYFLGVF